MFGAQQQQQLTPVSLPSGWDRSSKKFDLVHEAMIVHMQRDGYVWFKEGSHSGAMRLKELLGESLYVTHVKENIRSKSLLATKKQLGPHTDHHEVDFILWYVHSHCDNGGETFLYPTNRIFDNCAELFSPHFFVHPWYKNIKCKEHKVFKGDTGEHVIIQQDNQKQSIFRNLATNMLGEYKPLVYYSFWLANHQEDDACKKWLHKFQTGIDITIPLQGRLEETDIFIFDNRLNLHARAEYFDPKRHLERHWIRALI